MEVSIYTLIRRDRESELQEIFLNLIINAWSRNDMINNHWALPVSASCPDWPDFSIVDTRYEAG